MPKKTCHCTRCNKDFPPVDMAANRRVCKKCHNKQERERREKQRKPLILPSAGKKREKPPVDAFENRDSLSAYLKTSLQMSLSALDALIEVNEERLEAAKAAGDAKAVHEAGKSLESCLQKKLTVNTDLMHRLQALEELRLKEEKAKPVQFVMMEAPPFARSIPLKYTPDHERAEHCLPPLPREFYDKNGDLIIGGRVLPADAYAVRVVCSRIPDYSTLMKGLETSRTPQGAGFYSDYDGLFIAEVEERRL